jgi:dipeptidyl-peptidase-4
VTPNIEKELSTELSDADYARAEQMLAPYRARRMPGSSVQPQWFSEGRRFWYQVGTRFVVVDPDDRSRRDAFDHDRLAAALSVASRRAVSAGDLPITAVEIGDSLQFDAFGSRWEWSDNAGTCVQLDGDQPSPFGEVVSPDKSWVAFRRDGNIWVRKAGATRPEESNRSRDGEQEFALTDDAEPQFDYGGLPDATGARALMRLLGLPPLFHVSWSPDSTRLLVQRIDQRGLPELVLVESSPRDGGRPVEHRTRYPMPGEAAQATMSWTILDVRDRTVVRQQDEPVTITHPTAIVYAWWAGKSGEAVHFLHQSRDARMLEL